MPYTDEQWKYYSDWKNYSKEKDAQYSDEQFEYFFNRLKKNEYFSIVRFGEGESRIVLKEQTLSRSELTFNPMIETNKKYVNDLENCAKVNDPNYFVGIQSYTYKPGEKGRPENEFIIQRQKVIELGNLPLQQYTCSRIFCNAYEKCNTVLINEIKKRDMYLICSENANEKKLGNFKKIWKIKSRDAWKNSIDLYDDITNTMNNIKDSVMICCAGFFGNIAISKLKPGSNFYLNVGSVYDPILLNRYTRQYQRENNANKPKNN